MAKSKQQNEPLNLSDEGLGGGATDRGFQVCRALRCTARALVETRSGRWGLRALVARRLAAAFSAGAPRRREG